MVPPSCVFMWSSLCVLISFPYKGTSQIGHAPAMSSKYHYFSFLMILFAYFSLCWLFVAGQAEAAALAAVHGLLVMVAAVVYPAWAPGTWAAVTPQALEHRLQQWWCTALVAPQRVGSSKALGQVRVFSIGRRQIPYH